MGSTLTGNTVASTYAGLLKTTDTGAVNSTLKTVSDGNGNDTALQVSTTAVNTTGDFTVATNKLSVTSSTGNTNVAGNLTVNGNKLTVLSATGNTSIAGTLSVSGNVSLNSDLTTTSRIVLNGNYGITQNASAASNLFAAPTTFNNIATFTGGMQFQSAVNMTNNLTVAGVTTLNGNVILGDGAGDTITITGTPTFAQTATFNGIANFNGNVALGSDTSDTVTVNAVSTFAGNASFNGNTTIGSDETDTLTVNAAFNPATVTYDPADFILIQDASDSNKIKKATVSSVFGKRYKSAEFSIPGSGPTFNYDLILDEAHGLGGVPDVVQVFLVCKTSGNGFSVGDIVPVDGVFSGSYSPAFGVSASSSNVTVYRRTFNGQMSLYQKNNTGSEIRVDLNLSDWKVIATAVRFN